MENHIRYTHKYFLEIFNIVVGIRAVTSCAVRRRSGNAAAVMPQRKTVHSITNAIHAVR